jgi:hypothetical protein
MPILARLWPALDIGAALLSAVDPSNPKVNDMPRELAKI